jgi:hypothetical protein
VVYFLLDRDWEGATHFLLALLLAGAAVTLLFASFGGGTPGEAVPEAATPVGHFSAAPTPVRHETPTRSFTVAGASFAVLPDPGGSWARTAAARPAAPGQRLVVAAVAVVNRSRRQFNPGLLSYLLRGPGGALYSPQRAGVVGPAGLGLASGLPRGARAEERLVFSVPARFRHPVLALQPAATQALEVRVPLGG